MAIGFVVQTALPQSNAVTPAMQLTVISYCMLALISLASIAVFYLVSIEKRRAKRELRLGAKRSFQQRRKILGTSGEPAGLSSAAGLSASAAELGAAKDAQGLQPSGREAAFAAPLPSEHFAGGAQRAVRAGSGPPSAPPSCPYPKGRAGPPHLRACRDGHVRAARRQPQEQRQRTGQCAVVAAAPVVLVCGTDCLWRGSGGRRPRGSRPG
jgi:hypothetical protein